MADITFLDRVLVGEIQNPTDAIEEEVERWHSGSDSRELHEFLGMTWEEYGQWATNPQFLLDILFRRKNPCH